MLYECAVCIILRKWLIRKNSQILFSGNRVTLVGKNPFPKYEKFVDAFWRKTEKRILMQRLTGSLWVCSCFALSDELENFFVQLNSWAYLQLNGLSPVWDLMWIFRFSERAKARLQFSCCKMKFALQMSCRTFDSFANLGSSVLVLISFSRQTTTLCSETLFSRKLS